MSVKARISLHFYLPVPYCESQGTETLTELQRRHNSIKEIAVSIKEKEFLNNFIHYQAKLKSHS